MTTPTCQYRDNKTADPLRVPGFGNLPLHEELPISSRFAHGFKEWKQAPAITRREFAMVAVMNDVTDKPGWHVDIFNHDVADCWRDQILASAPLMSEKTWEWCVSELRDKATYFKDKGTFAYWTLARAFASRMNWVDKSFASTSSEECSLCLRSVKKSEATAPLHMSSQHCTRWFGGRVRSWLMGAKSRAKATLRAVRILH
jgi:hypothetical protein